MINLKGKKRGFTLLEMLLVLVIVSSMVVMGVNYTSQKADELKRDMASMQYQQILNAGLAYNLSLSTWPTLAQLTANGYLPNLAAINNPWGNPYLVATVNTPPNGGTLFYVLSRVPSGTARAFAQATTLAGRLPLGFATKVNPPDATKLCTVASATCFVAAAVPTPGQNLNNARSVNFVNLYHHGACVPAPACPANMTPEILTVPVEVAGANDITTPPAPPNVYPISYFKAFATGGAGGSPVAAPPSCTGGALACTISTPSPVGTYWRACMQVVTAQGDVSVTNTGVGAKAWGQYVTIMAVTRCVPGNPSTEPVGSDFTVFTK